MRKKLKENGIVVGSLAVAGVCTLTGNCQIGAMAMMPAVLYQGALVLKSAALKVNNKRSIQS